ncbi:hypothetical protein JCM12178A_18310 [Salidesulfovibrio brasiliensis]
MNTVGNAILLHIKMSISIGYDPDLRSVYEARIKVSEFLILVSTESSSWTDLIYENATRSYHS